jgi:hypothetical protein
VKNEENAPSDNSLDPFQEIFGNDADREALAADPAHDEQAEAPADADQPPAAKRKLAPLLASAAVVVVLLGMGYSYVSPMLGTQAPPPAQVQVEDPAAADAEDVASLADDEDLLALGAGDELVYQPPVTAPAADIDALFGRDDEAGETVDASTFSLPQDQIDLLASAEDIDKLIEMFRNSEARITSLEEAVAARDVAMAERDEIIHAIAIKAREAEALALATTEIITDVVRLQGSMGTAEELIVDMSRRIAALEQVDPADRATIERRLDDINTRMQGMARDLGLLARLAMEQPGPHQSAQPTAPVPGALSVYEDARGRVAPAPTADQIPADVAVGDMIDGYGEVLDVMDTDGGGRLVVMENASVMID